ncbi:hypothetical protein LTR13_005064 [Exophiala sideris]|nr:hypothetical protein LTR13_005064 [Exophiala sideris]KAK5182416.1 hypothetical protein LTR44_005428 [Eurotiomycetes sp. CCFEE 6388]
MKRIVNDKYSAQQPPAQLEEDTASEINEPKVATKPSMKRSIDARSSSSVQALKSKIAEKEAQLSDTLSQISELPSFATQAEPAPTSSDLQYRGGEIELTDNDQAALAYSNHVFSRHISLLKKYNEIKDITQGMLSIIAEIEGRRLAEIMEEYGLDEKD